MSVNEPMTIAPEFMAGMGEDDHGCYQLDRLLFDGQCLVETPLNPSWMLCYSTGLTGGVQLMAISPAARPMFMSWVSSTEGF